MVLTGSPIRWREGAFRTGHILRTKNASTQILVYNVNDAPFFGADFNPLPDTVSHDPSRKSFLAKLTGIIAIVGFAPRLLAKLPATVAAPAPTSSASVVLRPDSRAVARRPESL